VILELKQDFKNVNNIVFLKKVSHCIRQENDEASQDILFEPYEELVGVYDFFFMFKRLEKSRMMLHFSQLCLC